MILSCYPDFGKAPPEYVVNMIDLLSTYPDKTLVKLCDLRTGIVSQCAFLPSLAEIIRLAADIEIVDQMMQAEKEYATAERIKTEERANFMKAQEAKLIEVRKIHPTAQLDKEGRIIFFPDLEKAKQKPTPKQIEEGLRATERALMHQTRLSKYDRLN